MQVVVEGAVLYDGLAAVPLIALATGTNELNLLISPFKLCCAKVAEDADVSASAKLLSQGPSKTDATSLAND